MPPKNAPSIYPYLVASFIEAEKSGGTIEAIQFLTQGELENLKDEHKNAAHRNKIVDEAKRREASIFSLLTGLSEEGDLITYTLSKATKKRMGPLLDHFSFLYEHRMGKTAASEQKKVFSSNKDEPYEFYLEYEMHPVTRRFVIKSLLLKKIEDDDENDGIESNFG